MGGHRAVTVASRMARDNAVLEYHLGTNFVAEDAAALALACDIPAESAIADHWWMSGALVPQIVPDTKS
jgi:hypothetical protein